MISLIGRVGYTSAACAGASTAVKTIDAMTPTVQRCMASWGWALGRESHCRVLESPSASHRTVRELLRDFGFSRQGAEMGIFGAILDKLRHHGAARASQEQTGQMAGSPQQQPAAQQQPSGQAGSQAASQSSLQNVDIDAVLSQ